MTAQRWVQIEELFHRVIDCDPGQRAQLLEKAGKTDPDLRQEVEALLSAQGSAGGHLEAAVREGREDAVTACTLDWSEAAPGTSIGPYHLMELIGEGGMGEVWLAEQKQPVRRRVALKLIKAGMDTRQIVRRFESERQALALMDHPTIAKVFDAGSTSHGHPYFAMEYVAGLPITAYCDKHKLTTRERLELFIHVCEGVQHAHQKAIIHRDLKPSNILVSEVDGKPMPRIIDFGVAKAISQPLTAETMYTRAGAVVGTPGYMSPEQADSAGEDIDTRTDVYSLGVVLYELLVGALPLDLQNLPFDELLQKLREQDAPRPSTKLRSLGPEGATTAQNRGTDPPTLARLLHGDLDAITLKALEKDRSRRYASPSELAADIRRHLRHEPVIARPASTAYRARKYARRHRIGVVFAAALAILVAAAAIAQTIQLRRVTRERDRADRITNFMTSMFKLPDPSEARGNQVTAREMLDKASKDINTGLSKDPELQAQMMHTMAETYGGLGLFAQDERLLRRAIEIEQRRLGPKDAALLPWKSELSESLLRQGRYQEAESFERATLEKERQLLGPEHEDTLSSRYVLGEILENEGKFQEAEQLQRETLHLQRRAFGSGHPDTLRTEEDLASIFRDEGHFRDSEELYRKIVEVESRRDGEDHPHTLYVISMLSNVLQCEGHFVESEKLARKVLDADRRILGPGHMMTLNAMAILAVALQGEGRYTEAEELQRESLDARRRSYGSDHPQTLRTAAILGSILTKEGRYREAGELQREVLETQRRLFGAGNFDAASSAYDLAETMALSGKKDEAFTLLNQAIAHAMPEIVAQIETDPELKSLHGDPRFTALVAQARQRAALSPKHR